MRTDCSTLVIFNTNTELEWMAVRGPAAYRFGAAPMTRSAGRNRDRDAKHPESRRRRVRKAEHAATA